MPKPRRTASQAARLSAAENALRQASMEPAAENTNRDTIFNSLFNPTINEVVPPSALIHLKETYKYSVIDKSIMQKYLPLDKSWNFFASLLPITWAPNFVTFLGLLCALSYPLVIMYFEFVVGGSGGEENEIPNWVWLFSALMVYAYHIFDCIDGKQARRTNCCSPLGELCDHSADNFQMPFMIYAVSRGLGFSPQQTFLYSLILSFGLYSTMLDQFLSKTLYFGYVNAGTESVYLSLSLHLWTFFAGGQKYWKGKSETVSTIFSYIQHSNSDNTNNNSILQNYVYPLMSKIFSPNGTTTRGDVWFFIFIVFMSLGAFEVSYLAFQGIGKNGNRKDVIKSFLLHIGVFLLWALYAYLNPQDCYSHAVSALFIFGSYFSYAATNLTVHRFCNLPLDLSRRENQKQVGGGKSSSTSSSLSYMINFRMILCVLIPLVKIILYFATTTATTTNTNNSRFLSILFQNKISQQFLIKPLTMFAQKNEETQYLLSIFMILSYGFYLISVLHQFSRACGVNILTMTQQQKDGLKKLK